MIVEGRAVVIPGADVNTDVMYPGQFLNIDDPEEMKPYLFEGFDPSLRDQLGDDAILVIGPNFGIGSSREHVPIAMQANGVRGVVGRSFARIFFRNCTNLGLAAVACPDAVDAARDGSAIAIDPSGAVVVDGRRFPVPPAPALLTELADAGGLVAWTERELAGG